MTTTWAELDQLNNADGHYQSPSYIRKARKMEQQIVDLWNAEVNRCIDQEDFISAKAKEMFELVCQATELREDATMHELNCLDICTCLPDRDACSWCSFLGKLDRLAEEISNY